MTITHHPDVSSLMSCAAGSQPEAQAAVIAAHVSMCPRCQKELRRMELIGAALFESITPAPIRSQVPVAAARAQEADLGTPSGNADAPRAAGPSTTSAEAMIPHPLRAILKSGLADIPWKRLAPGIWHYPIPLSAGAKGQLRLVKVAPGTAIPEHGHGGEEVTLLLEGSYADELGEFRRGDISDLDEEIEHHPVADAKEGCICLVATEKAARFKGFLARMLQPLTGM